MKTPTEPPFVPTPDENPKGYDVLFDAVLAEDESAAAERRGRLLERVGASARAHADLLTVRQRHARWQSAAEGVRTRSLVECGSTTPATFRPGQPRSARIVELAPGARWLDAGDLNDQREWLVLEGDVLVQADDMELPRLAPLDFHLAPAGLQPRRLSSVRGARLYRRSAPRPASAASGGASRTVMAATSPWEQYGPGIARRTLWSTGVEASYLVRAQKGAQVPGHGHRFDEECLMLDGDLYIGDVLLRAGDYQLAPVGSRHGHHLADTDLTLLVRGDVELQFDA